MPEGRGQNSALTLHQEKPRATTSESIDFPCISFQSLKAGYRSSQMKKKKILNIVFRNYFMRVLIPQHLPPPKLPKVNICRFTESWNSIMPCRSFCLILQCQVALNVKRNPSLCRFTYSSHGNFFCSAGIYFSTKSCQEFWRKCSADLSVPNSRLLCFLHSMQLKWWWFSRWSIFNDFCPQIHLFWKFKPPSKAGRCN